jgi:DNA repair protein RAD7
MRNDMLIIRYRLKGVVLPEKIKCGRCSKNLPQAKYSIKQLTDARWQVKNVGRINKSINCQPCTGQRVVEVECTMCGKTKGLEDFAKSQRSKPDTAKCFKCVEVQLADLPVNEDRYEEPEKAFITPDHSNGQIPEYWSSATSTTDSSSTYVSTTTPICLKPADYPLPYSIPRTLLTLTGRRLGFCQRQPRYQAQW